MRLRLVKLTAQYQGHLTEMMDEWSASGEKIVPSAIARNDYRDFDYYLAHLEIREPKEGRVPDSTFFCLDEERDIFVGAVNIRHYLTDAMLQNSGHIGDGVRPSERGTGVAARMIGLALGECRKLGLYRVLMVCDKENRASAKSIVNSGGVLENEVETGGVVWQRYWIDTKLLLLEDEKNYSEDMPLIERYATRGIIQKDGKFAMQLSGDGEYKLPGGGVEEGESFVDALCREVAEETGLVIDRASVKYCGEVIEIRRDIYEEDKKYIKHSLVYFCEAGEERVEMSMTKSELERGFHPVWESLDTILAENRKNLRDWRLRDTKVLELLLERGLVEK